MLGPLLLLSATQTTVPVAPSEPLPVSLAHQKESATSSDIAETAAPTGEGAADDPPLDAEGPTPEERIQELERRIAEQDERINLLERGQPPSADQGETEAKATAKRRREMPQVEEPPPAADQAQRGDPLQTLTSTDFPGSIPLFGSDFRFALGGYVKMDVLYDFSGHPDRYRFTLSGIPKAGDPEHAPYLSMHARESRLEFDVRYMGKHTPPNQALVEIDFFTPSQPGFVAPRLRHAYLRWGSFLAGQTWSVLTDVRPLPFIIDFAFSDSINATRVPQLRYTSKVSEHLELRAGLEMPQTGGVDNPDGVPGAVSPRLPRAAVNASFDFPRGFVSGGVSLEEIRWDTDDTRDDPTALAWMTVVSARYLFDPQGRAFIGAQGSVGHGTGELVGALAGQDSNATLQAGALDPLLSGHGMIGAGIRWIEAISTNAAIAWDVLLPDAERSPDALEWAWSVHANVIGRVSEPLQIGLEGMIGQSANVDGRVGRGSRIEAMAMYSF